MTARTRAILQTNNTNNITNQTGAATITPSVEGSNFADIIDSAFVTLTDTLMGDVTTTAGSLSTTLATVNSNVGSFGSTTLIPVITTNAKGLITAVSTATVASTGTVNSGTAGQFALYSATGAAVSGLPLYAYDTTVASPINGFLFQPGAAGTGVTIIPVLTGSDTGASLTLKAAGSSQYATIIGTSTWTTSYNGSSTQRLLMTTTAATFGTGLAVTVSSSLTVTGTTTHNGATVMAGKIQQNRTAVADVNYTSTGTENIIAYTSLTAARTVTVTPGGTATNPKMWILKNETANTSALTLTPSSGTFDGNASASISGAYLSKSFYDNGTNFFMI